MFISIPKKVFSVKCLCRLRHTGEKKTTSNAAAMETEITATLNAIHLFLYLFLFCLDILESNHVLVPASEM